MVQNTGAKQGTKSGRSIGRPRMPPKTEAEIRAMLRKGLGTKAIQAALGVGVAKIVTIKRELSMGWAPDGLRYNSLSPESPIL
jgi:hypothetical protein